MMPALHRVCRRSLILAALCLIPGNPLRVRAETPPGTPFTLQKGDLVTLVGETFVEREYTFGQLETALTLAAGDRAPGLRFRNLGWSGDSVFGDARSYFGPPQEGFDRLMKTLGDLQPTVLVFCYGTVPVISEGQPWTEVPDLAARLGDPEAGLAVFLEGYERLVLAAKAASGAGIREIVLVSPPPLERVAPPLPDLTGHNVRLAAYRDAIRDLAKQHGWRFADLFDAMGGGKNPVQESAPLTDDGIHYGQAGYALAGSALAKSLGLAMPTRAGTEAPVEALRQAVVKKNRLFFHRWRPANETYLFLFRKHEQGQNAKEMPMFDPLIAAEEEKVAALAATALERLKQP